MASTAPASAPLPKIVYIPPGSVTNPAGYVAPAGAAAPAGTAAAPAQAPTAPAGQAAPTQADPARPAPGTPDAGATQAVHGVSMLTRVLGVLPLLAGVTQILVGLAITRGTLPVAGIPLIGALPKFLVGGLVAATSTTSVMQGIGKLLGKTP